MRIKKILKQLFLVQFLLFSVLSLPALAVAVETHNWVVRSEYQSPVPGRQKSTIWWQFQPQILGDGVMVEVTDLNGRVKTRAELYFDQENALSQADCYRQRRGEEICDARIYDSSVPVLLNQSLVPGDWLNRGLPFVPQVDSVEYLIKTKIGTTGFSLHVLITDAMLDVAEARTMGMINSDNEALLHGQKLYLVTVRKVLGSNMDSVLLRQLWVSGDNFWIFEEKGGRRSWRSQLN